MRAIAEVFAVFLRLGLTAFGGPIAHLGYFRAEFVARRHWLSEADYADLVALCQFLPGPTSSQVGLAIGRLRAGLPGAVAAFLGFTLPSALIMLALAYGVSGLELGALASVLHGLKIAALVIVAQAVWAMAASLAPDRPRRALALGAAAVMLAFPVGILQPGLLVIAALYGATRAPVGAPALPRPAPSNPTQGMVWIILFSALLLALPLLAPLDPLLSLADRFYRAGSLVFGGGHVVLPLLDAELVAPGWISRDTFLAGYGAAQAMPGPLFAFAAYAGAAQTAAPGGWLGGLVALAAIYLPSFALVFGALPFWQRFRQAPRLRAALDGANAAVVGLLLAALYDPVFTGAVTNGRDAAFALAAFALFTLARLPPWLLVIGCGSIAYLLGLLP